MHKRINFATFLEKSPLLGFFFIYLYSILIAAVLSPFFFNIVAYWDFVAPSPLSHYLLNKGLGIFFERIRLLTVLLFLPLLLHIFFKGARPHIISKTFLNFFLLGVLISCFIFGLRLLFDNNTITVPQYFWLLTLKALIGSLTLAFLEELLFRGIILNSLRTHFPAFAAAVISSLMFAYFHFRAHTNFSLRSEFANLSDGWYCANLTLFHTVFMIDWLKFSILFLLGSFLSLLVMTYQSLSPSIGTHAGIVFALMLFKKFSQNTTQLPFFGSIDLFDSYFVLLLLLIINGFCIVKYVSSQNKIKNAS